MASGAQLLCLRSLTLPATPTLSNLQQLQENGSDYHWCSEPFETLTLAAEEEETEHDKRKPLPTIATSGHAVCWLGHRPGSWFVLGVAGPRPLSQFPCAPVRSLQSLPQLRTNPQLPLQLPPPCKHSPLPESCRAAFHLPTSPLPRAQHWGTEVKAQRPLGRPPGTTTKATSR